MRPLISLCTVCALFPLGVATLAQRPSPLQVDRADYTAVCIEGSGDPCGYRFTLVARYENASVDAIRAATGWPLQVAPTVEVIAPPSDVELQTLRDLHERTRAAHAGTRVTAELAKVRTEA